MGHPVNRLKTRLLPKVLIRNRLFPIPLGKVNSRRNPLRKGHRAKVKPVRLLNATISPVLRPPPLGTSGPDQHVPLGLPTPPHQSELPVGGEDFIFRRPVGETDRRQMDTINCQTGLQARISPVPPSDNTTLATIGNNKTPYCGSSRGIITEKRNKNGEPSRRRPRVLQPLLPSSQKIRRVAPDFELDRVEQICDQEKFSHGIEPLSTCGSRTPRLASVDRSKRRLFPHRDPSRFPAILPVSSQRQAVSIYGSPVRASKRSTGIHSNSGYTGSSATPTGRQVTSVPRRLAVAGSKQTSTMYSSAQCVDTFSVSRLFAEYGKIVYNPESGYALCGNATPHQTRSSHPHTGESRQVITDNAHGILQPQSTSASTFSPIGNNGVSNRHCPLGKTTSSPNPTLLAGNMETESRSIISRDSNTTSFTVTFNVVDGRGQLGQGNPLAGEPPRSIPLHGCIPPRMGGTSRSPPRSREVVNTSPAVSHQLARTSSGISVSPEIRRSCDQPQCVSQYRQHDSGRLHKQNGGDTIPNPVLPVVGYDDVVSGQGSISPCQTFTGQKEPHCRRIVSQSGGSNNRVDSPSGSSQPSVLPLGDTDDGSVCNFREPQTPDLRLPHSRPSGNGSGRAINILERNSSVRIPSNSTNPPRSEQDSERGNQCNIDSPTVAQQIVVSPTVRPVSRSPPPATGSGGSSVSGARPGTSRPKSVPPTRVQIIEQSVMANGFSRDAAAIIARPQRASTLATYEHKWQKFTDWCSGRKINPLTINESQLADFLLHLFANKKFATRSIAVYRTAISATIKNSGGGGFWP